MSPKIIFAFDSFKGSLSSTEAGEAAAEGARKVLPEADVEVIAIADGGEGTIDAIVPALCGEYVNMMAEDPIGRPIDTLYGICGDTAVVETASASGLTLLSESERDPWITSSFGMGRQIADAITRGCRNFLIGLGGSAVNDAGVGMLCALGYRFLDEEGREVKGGGGSLKDIVSIDDTHILPALSQCSFTLACDVSNPLTGPEGASMVFAPQKGASAEMCRLLDSSLLHFAEVSAAFLGEDFSTRAGAGAAGGLGFAFMAFLRATMKSGIDMVLDTLDFNNRIKDASLIFTGEGSLDLQTCMGKAPSGVLSRARKAGIPVIAVGGAISRNAVEELINVGFAAVFPMIDAPMSLSDAMIKVIAAENMSRTVEHILRVSRMHILDYK